MSSSELGGVERVRVDILNHFDPKKFNATLVILVRGPHPLTSLWKPSVNVIFLKCARVRCGLLRFTGLVWHLRQLVL